MIGFNATMQAEQGSDVSSLIAQILADNVMALSRKNKLAADVFDKIVRKSLGRTGTTIRKALKSGFKDGTLSLEPLHRHPSGAMMTDTLAKYRSQDLVKGMKIRPAIVARKPGGKFANMMQYEIDEHDGKNLTIGMIPKRRGGEEWAKRFKAWQEQGDIDIDQFYPKRPIANMYKYFIGLGMPINKKPSRPQRDVIGKIEGRENPVQMFEKFFLERLLA